MQSNNQPYPRLTVAVIVEQQGHFLMVEEREDTKVVINQPAGHVEPGESPIAAAIRETFEETAWKVQPTAIIGCYHYLVPKSNTSYFRICYLAEGIEFFSLQPLDKDIIAAKWLTLSDISARDQSLRSPLVLRCIQDYLKGQRYPLTMITQID